MLSEGIDILLETDIVNIICTLKEKKKEKALNKERNNEMKDHSTNKRRSEKREQEKQPKVIDNSQQTCDNCEYSLPQNKIIRFEEVTDDVEGRDCPLRIRKPSYSTRENTNTPTINMRDETKRRRTRRGKRAGKQVQGEDTQQKEFKENSKSLNQTSFLDFIVDNDPEITTNTEASAAFSLMEETNNASPIKHSKEEDSVGDFRSSFPMPLLHDIVSCELLHLDRASKTPVIDRVKGKVIK